MEELRPVLTLVLGGATHEDVKLPLRPYQRIGKSVSDRWSLPTSAAVVE